MASVVKAADGEKQEHVVKAADGEKQEHVVKAANSDKQEGHLRAHNVKTGMERLDRRSGTGKKGSPKKGGHGGKFTWAGDRSRDLTNVQADVTVLDDKDPNYEEEAL